MNPCRNLWLDFANEASEHRYKLRSCMDSGLPAFKPFRWTIWIVVGKLIADLTKSLPVISALKPAQLL